jgi:glucose-6-phosphate isomerase
LPKIPLPLQSATARSLHCGAERLRGHSLRTLFAEDSGRCDRLRREACGLELDFSRQLLDGDVLQQLLALANEAQLPRAMRALIGGAEVNVTEGRPALHSALRAPRGSNGEVDAARDTMRRHVDELRGGARRGFSGETISDVVNIGIGGSDLGPRLIAEALGDSDTSPRCHFVANVDPDDLQRCLARLDPARTLFIVCSKSFGTEETKVNAEAARHWLRSAGAGEAQLAAHFLAVSSNLEAAAAFGIPGENCLPMWDWVGGRYSLWSAVGLSAAIALGWERFEALLAGAHAMDQHADTAPAADNLPMLCALIDCWNSHFLGAETLAVLPYAQRLARLPDYLQQLVMESSGKRVTSDGSPLPYHSAPVLWGSAGTIGQHSFHQLLHQGTRLTALELILPLDNPEAPAQHARLVAHGLAQSSVFAFGRSQDEALAALLSRGTEPGEAQRLAPHLAIPGNRPLSLLSFDRLTPRALGALLALWEHRTYLNACLLGINAFDQWGVELGKVVSGQIQAAMASAEEDAGLDSATRRMLGRWRSAGES